MKTVIGIKTAGGYEHTFFCPNEEAHKLVSELVEEKNWDLVGLRNLDDKGYFIRKMANRVRELERTISTFDYVKSDSHIDSVTKGILKNTLLDSIFTQIGVLTGMMRRNYKRNYGFNDKYLIQILEDWNEREDY